MIIIVYHPSTVQHMVKEQMTESNISVGFSLGHWYGGERYFIQRALMKLELFVERYDDQQVEL